MHYVIQIEWNRRMSGFVKTWMKLTYGNTHTLTLIYVATYFFSENKIEVMIHYTKQENFSVCTQIFCQAKKKWNQ